MALNLMILLMLAITTLIVAFLAGRRRGANTEVREIAHDWLCRTNLQLQKVVLRKAGQPRAARPSTGLEYTAPCDLEAIWPRVQVGESEGYTLVYPG